MRNNFIALVIVLYFAFSATAQDTRPKGEFSTVDLQDIAKVKIHVAKNSYRGEEVVKLNIGVLIDSISDVFVPEERSFKVIIHDAKGAPVKVRTIHVSGLKMATDSAFKKTKSDYFVASESIFLGCESPVLQNESMRVQSLIDIEQSKPRDAYEIGVYENLAESCIDASVGGPLTVSVEFINREINKAGSKEAPTATGVVSSNAVKFQLVN